MGQKSICCFIEMRGIASGDRLWGSWGSSPGDSRSGGLSGFVAPLSPLGSCLWDRVAWDRVGGIVSVGIVVLGSCVSVSFMLGSLSFGDRVSRDRAVGIVQLGWCCWDRVYWDRI